MSVAKRKFAKRTSLKNKRSGNVKPKDRESLSVSMQFKRQRKPRTSRRELKPQLVRSINKSSSVTKLFKKRR